MLRGSLITILTKSRMMNLWKIVAVLIHQQRRVWRKPNLSLHVSNLLMSLIVTTKTAKPKMREPIFPYKPELKTRSNERQNLNTKFEKVK